jgi:hypothetical protein
MFGAEAFEPASEEEIQEFELYAAAQLKRRIIDAAWATAAFATVVIFIIPFSAGHRFHRYWEIAKYLIWVAMALWAWLVLKAGLIWAEWQSARETRREFQ